MVCVITVLSSCANQILLQAQVRQRYFDDEACFLFLIRAVIFSVSVVPFGNGVFVLSCSVLNLNENESNVDASLVGARETLTGEDIPDGLLVSEPSVRKRASGSTRLRHDMRQYRSFFKKRTLDLKSGSTTKVMSWEVPRKMLERGSKSYVRSGWLAFCVCARRGRFRCVAGRLGGSGAWCCRLSLLLRHVAWLCRSGLYPSRSVSSLFLKKGDDPRKVLRAASLQLPFSGIPAIVTPDDRFLSFSILVASLEAGVDRTLHRFVADTFWNQLSTCASLATR